MTISTLLIANRGEIALRIIRAARAMGIRTVAVYSDADREALHVRAADVAVHIGPTPATESYLNVEALLDAARRTGADAVHPGYGFLSERAHFARAVTDAGLVFVGPTAEVIERMGRKDHARGIAEKAGVPVVPIGVSTGSTGASLAGMSFPVLIKAAAGGGGKGMRIVGSAEEYDAALASAKREAASAFGDDTIIVERYIERGRHVEVQILADHHGNVVHLFERDCSAQRRHQKVIEEAPAPGLSAAARTLLHDSAVALSREVGYTNAGTVEFLVSGEEGAEEVFFLEMNTRLQVEHPVTEAVVGLDLVQLQLRIASGEPLPFTQDDVTCTGHAFEARVYAEDAFGGFLPQAGTATAVHWSERARIDAALESGSVVGTAYDPMLGKVIVAGPTREAARRQLVAALDETAILGLTTNLGFVRALADSDVFRDGEVDTAWLDRNPDTLTAPDSTIAGAVAAYELARVAGTDHQHPFGSGDGWRSAGPAAPSWVELHDLVYVVDQAAGEVRFGDGVRGVRPVGGDVAHRYQIGSGAAGAVHSVVVAIAAHQVEASHQGHRFVFRRPDAMAPGEAASLSDGSVLAPMPGTVLAVSVAVGDTVTDGQVLGIMEAMKMELSLKAPYDGTVTHVGPAKGDQVALGDRLFAVEA